MERKLPKNIRQIGNVSDNPKVYVEDYVDTFLTQMCEKSKEEISGAFLIGESFRKDDQDYIFIYGAVQMQDVEMKGNEVVIGDKTWKKACEEGKKYFAGNTILGWFLTAPGLQVKLNHNLIKLHEKLFMRKSRILILKEAQEKEEALFVYKYNDLMHIAGHYVYYEKNPSMQEYMIETRKQNCVTPSESVEDRATKDFRSIIKKKEETQKEASKKYYSYKVSVFLLLILVACGVVSMNNYEGLQKIQVVMVNAVAKIRETPEETGYIETELLVSEELIVESVATEEEEEVEMDVIEILEVEENEIIEEVGEVDVIEEVVEENITEEGQGDEQSANIYIVEDGDTLAQISRDLYGDISRVEEICELNNLVDSDYIYIGQELLMP